MSHLAEWHTSTQVVAGQAIMWTWESTKPCLQAMTRVLFFNECNPIGHFSHSIDILLNHAVKCIKFNKRSWNHSLTKKLALQLLIADTIVSVIGDSVCKTVRNTIYNEASVHRSRALLHASMLHGDSVAKVQETLPLPPKMQFSEQQRKILYPKQKWASIYRAVN